MMPNTAKNPRRLLSQDAFRKTYAEQAFASQLIPCASGNLTVCCHLICLSPAKFTNAMAFRHLSPPFSRIFALQGGAASLTMGGKRCSLEPGRFYLIPAGCSFDIDYPSGLNTIACHANFNDGAGFSLTQNFSEPLMLENGALFDAVVRTPPENTSTLLALFMAAACELFAPYFEDFAKRSSFAVGIYKEVLEYIGKTPPGLIRIEQLAKKFHVSRAMLSKGFYRHFGIPLKAHLQEILLNQAKQMLIGTDLSPKEIASRLGLCELSNFYRFFRRHTGVTPIAYRECSREEKKSHL